MFRGWSFGLVSADWVNPAVLVKFYLNPVPPKVELFSSLVPNSSMTD